MGARRDLGTRSKSDNVPDNVYPIVNDSKSKYADPDVFKTIENFKTAIKSCKTKFESKCPF
ncbi:bifunctional permease/carbonic anhydrase [Leptospira borgpetersenii serovar Ceylonica]|nr:bifunctional permease/carbonic anhydrase [Leptospira borgpetersenii serovar Ceylonica]